jgi:sugar phosphate permease
MSTVVAAQTLPLFPGWRPQFWIAATLGAVTALVIFIFYRDLSPRVRGLVSDAEKDVELEEAGAEAADGGPVGPVVAAPVDHYLDGKAVYRSPRLWILSGTIVFWSLTYVTVSGYVPVYLAQHYGLEPARAAGVTAWFWVVFTCSVFLSGWLSDRLRVRKTVTAFGGITTGTCFLIGANLPVGTSADVLALVWSLTGFFAGFIYPSWCALYSETAESISPHGVGRAFGITATLSPLAGLTLNLGLPRVVENWGWSVWMTFAGCCCLGVAVLVSFGQGPWWVRKAERQLQAPRESPA